MAMLFLARILHLYYLQIRKWRSLIQKRNDSDWSKEQVDDLIMDQGSQLDSFNNSVSILNSWEIEPDVIEPNLLLVSSIESEELPKYVRRTLLKEDLQDLMILLEGNLKLIEREPIIIVLKVNIRKCY